MFFSGNQSRAWANLCRWMQIRFLKYLNAFKYLDILRRINYIVCSVDLSKHNMGGVRITFFLRPPTKSGRIKEIFLTPSLAYLPVFWWFEKNHIIKTTTSQQLWMLSNFIMIEASFAPILCFVSVSVSLCYIFSLFYPAKPLICYKNVITVREIWDRTDDKYFNTRSPTTALLVLFEEGKTPRDRGMISDMDSWISALIICLNILSTERYSLAFVHDACVCDAR